MLHIFLIKNEKHLQISLSKSQWYDLLFLRYRAKQTVIRNFTSFFALYPPKNLKNQNFEKWKNLLEISSFYTCAPKIRIIWCTVPEIWSETDKHFCNFGPFFAKILKKMKKMPGDIILLYIHVYHKWRSYDIWFLKYKVWQTEIFDIFSHFLPFQSLDNLENQNFNIEKSTWRYYHFTHLYHKWQSYDVWFLRYKARQT